MEKNMFFFDGFTAFNFNEGAPYVSITKNGVTFNKSVIMKLKYYQGNDELGLFFGIL